ncbi:MAG: sugar phosphate isomerase/epimerase family protein [Opitutales bacterium]
MPFPNRIACSSSVRCGFDLPDAVTALQNGGFQQIDLLVIDGWAHVNTSDLAADFEQTVAGVDALLGPAGLKPVAMNTGVGPQLWERTDAHNETRQRETDALLRFMKHYGVTVAALQPKSQDNSRPWETVLEDCVATLTEQIEAGQAKGVTFCLELHVNSPFESEAQARRVLEVMPDLPVVYDPTHFVMQGMDIRDTTWIMKNAGHAHLRDAAKGKLQAPFGEGEVDFDWVLGTLRDTGYEGLFSIEYLGGKKAEFDIVDSARRLHDKIAEYFPPTS